MPLKQAREEFGEYSVQYQELSFAIFSLEMILLQKAVVFTRDKAAFLFTCFRINWI